MYEDELIHASHWFDEGPAYLGTFLLQTKRHAAGVADLTEDEARDVGLRSARIARALKATVDAEKVSTYVFGEAVPHFHEFVVARYRGVPETYWRLNLADWPEAPRGDERADADLARQVRDALRASTQ